MEGEFIVESPRKNYFLVIEFFSCNFGKIVIYSELSRGNRSLKTNQTKLNSTQLKHHEKVIHN